MRTLELLEMNVPDGKTRAVFENAKAKIGKVPNMIRLMAHSPVVADIYLEITERLSQGVLSPVMRELIALTVANENVCQYCLQAHAAKAARMGVSNEEIKRAVLADQHDAKMEIALKFAQEIIRTRAANEAVTVEHLMDAGWSRAEISEIIAVATLNVFPNYFNKLIGTPVDFPEFK